MRDPNMRTGAITAQEISDRFAGCADNRWCNGEASITDAYSGNVTLTTILLGKYTNASLGKSPNADLSLQQAADVLYTALYPTMLGDKVFLLTLADIAETYLEEFESSEFSSPEPRDMVDGIRELAFGNITRADLSVKVDAAYAGENSRSKVFLYGNTAMADLTDLDEVTRLVVKLYLDISQNKTLEQVQAILNQMKKYDKGTIDLTDAVSVKPLKKNTPT